MNVPSVRGAVAKQSTRSTVLPRAPSSGDSGDVHPPEVGDKGSTIKLGGSSSVRKKYPPRTPDQLRAYIPCSYAEHVSCIGHQVTSDRARSPVFYFSGLPRFQDRYEKRDRISERKIDTNQKPHAVAEVPALRPGSTSCALASVARRGKKKKRRKRRGGARIFRRGSYGWLTSCLEPEQWEPTLNLVDDSARPLTADPSTTRTLVDAAAPRPVLRHGRRHNPSEYNPQRRTLPRENDKFPGPKYDRPPGAFGRTGGGGSVLLPSASVSSLDRFPRGRLFEEEDMREREATPGPEAYDVVLCHRLEGVAFEEMQVSLETLACWDGVEAEAASDGPFASSDEVGVESQTIESSENEGGVAAEGVQATPPCCGFSVEALGSERQAHGGPRGIAQPSVSGRSCAPCSAGGSVRPSSVSSTTVQNRRCPRGRCSRLSPASSAAVSRGLPCHECLDVEVACAARSFVTAASSLSEENLFRRAQTSNASVRFGHMPRQRSAPAFSIGSGARDVSSRLLHSPAETVYKEARLGRSGPGPTTSCPRAGDALTRPRPLAARVIPPSLGRRCGGSGSGGGGGHGAGGGDGDVEATEGGVIDGALGVQVKSGRPTCPSISLAGPRRTATLFHERLRYLGKNLSPMEYHRAQPKTFFNAHVPNPAMVKCDH
ncbi:unnamed protein product [Laminaria digitata]